MCGGVDVSGCVSEPARGGGNVEEGETFQPRLLAACWPEARVPESPGKPVFRAPCPVHPAQLTVNEPCSRGAPLAGSSGDRSSKHSFNPQHNRLEAAHPSPLGSPVSHRAQSSPQPLGILLDAPPKKPRDRKGFHFLSKEKSEEGI